MLDFLFPFPSTSGFADHFHRVGALQSPPAILHARQGRHTHTHTKQKERERQTLAESAPARAGRCQCLNAPAYNCFLQSLHSTSSLLAALAKWGGVVQGIATAFLTMLEGPSVCMIKRRDDLPHVPWPHFFSHAQAVYASQHDHRSAVPRAIDW